MDKFGVLNSDKAQQCQSKHSVALIFPKIALAIRHRLVVAPKDDK